MSFINPVCPSFQKCDFRRHTFVKFCTENFTKICQNISTSVHRNISQFTRTIMVSFPFICTHNKDSVPSEVRAENSRGSFLIGALSSVRYEKRLERELSINPSKTKRRLLYLKAQFVPRSKHFSSRL